MLMLFTFIIYPSFYQFYLSVHRGSGIAPMEFVGTGQYQQVFADGTFWRKVLPNTAIYAIGVVIGQLSIGLLIASLLNAKLPVNLFVRPLFFIPLSVSLAAVSVVFLGLFGGDDSAINGMLKFFGLKHLPYWLGLAENPGDPHDWLGNPRTDLFTVMVVALWHSLPYNIILMLAGLQSIDPQLYEAGKVDGAGPLQRFFHITIPEMMPIIIVIAFNGFIGAARAFGPVFILTEGGKNHSSEVVATYIFHWGFTKPADQQPDIGYAAALGVMYSLILGGLVFANVWIIAQRWRRRLEAERMAEAAKRFDADDPSRTRREVDDGSSAAATG
jgi:ABC-type sugar transport system permease subunit